jgi:hypothetical protein
MHENIVYRAFSQELPLQVRELVTEIEVFPFSTMSVNKVNQSLKIRAVWDTGATHTLITKRVKTELNLFPVDSTRILGVSTAQKRQKLFLSQLSYPIKSGYETGKLLSLILTLLALIC